MGPDLFNYSVNDIPIDDGSTHPSVFADDIALWATGRTIKEVKDDLQSSLRALETWACDADIEFSLEKTVAMLITNKKLVTKPTLLLDGHQIKFVEETKFLGCKIDSKLSWINHVNDVSRSCQKRLNVMKMLTGPKHGVKAPFLVEFYCKYVRPKIEYGLQIYGLSGISSLKKLDAIQNSALRIAFGARKTTPTKFLHSEAGVPLILTRMKIQALSYLQKVWISDNNPIKTRIIKTGRILTKNPSRKRNKQYCIEFALSLLNEEDVRLNLTMALKVPSVIQIPPWTLKSLSGSTEFPAIIIPHALPLFKRLTESLYKYHIQVFTDGSKDNQGVGLACLIPSLQISKKYCLPPLSSIFQAECIAIQIAVNVIRSYCQKHEPYVIFCDSKSVLTAILNFHLKKNKSFEIHKCYSMLLDSLNSGWSISLQWLPGHAGIPGNEAVDKLAKEAILDGEVLIPDTPNEISQIANIIQKITRNDQLLLSNTATSRISNDSMTSTKSNLGIYHHLNRQRGRAAFRIRSGHCGTGSYMGRFYGENPKCENCKINETLEHILFDCPSYVIYRKNIIYFFFTLNGLSMQINHATWLSLIHI